MWVERRTPTRRKHDPRNEHQEHHELQHAQDEDRHVALQLDQLEEERDVRDEMSGVTCRG
jgi:hypothetical protein